MRKQRDSAPGRFYKNARRSRPRRPGIPGHRPGRSVAFRSWQDWVGDLWHGGQWQGGSLGWQSGSLGVFIATEPVGVGEGPLVTPGHHDHPLHHSLGRWRITSKLSLIVDKRQISSDQLLVLVEEGEQCRGRY